MDIVIIGVELICVGIGEQIKKNELIKIAGNPNNVYTAANFQKLVSQSFIDEVKAKACPGNKAKGMKKILVDYDWSIMMQFSSTFD